MGYHETHVNSTLGVSFFPFSLDFFYLCLAVLLLFFYNPDTHTTRRIPTNFPVKIFGNCTANFT